MEQPGLPASDPQLSRSTTAVLGLDGKFQSILGAEPQSAGPVPTQSCLVPMGQGKGPSSHLKDISIDSGSSILETS